MTAPSKPQRYSSGVAFSFSDDENGEGDVYLASDIDPILAKLRLEAEEYRHGFIEGADRLEREQQEHARTRVKLSYYRETLCLAGSPPYVATESGVVTEEINPEKLGAVLDERDALSDRLSAAEDALPEGYRVDTEHDLAERIEALVKERDARIKFLADENIDLRMGLVEIHLAQLSPEEEQKLADLGGAALQRALDAYRASLVAKTEDEQ